MFVVGDVHGGIGDFDKLRALQELLWRAEIGVVDEIEAIGGASLRHETAAELFGRAFLVQPVPCPASFLGRVLASEQSDKAYNANELIDTLENRGIMPVVPSKANRLIQRKTDFALYRERNLVERFFCKLKAWAIATRYDKLANTFLAAIQLVCSVFWLNGRQALVHWLTYFKSFSLRIM